MEDRFISFDSFMGMRMIKIAGDMLLCDLCERRLRIEALEGPREVLNDISDWSHQLELSKRFGQPNQEPEKIGFYLFRVGICETCYQNRLTDAERTRHTFLNEGMAKLERARNGACERLTGLALELVRNRISLVTRETVCEFFGVVFDFTYGDPYAVGDKRRRLIKKFIQRNRDKMSSLLLCNRLVHDSSVIDETRDHIRRSNEGIVELLSGLRSNLENKEFTMGWVNLQAIIDAGKLTSLGVEKSAWRPAADSSFYFIHEISLTSIEHGVLHKADELGFDGFSIVKSLEEEFIKRLFEIK